MIEAALASLTERADPGSAARQRVKGARRPLGVSAEAVSALVTEWRAVAEGDARLDLAQALWASDIFEAALAAAKLLTQARIRPDARVWALLQSWVPGLDDAALADAVAGAAGRRLIADPSRLDIAEVWVGDANPLVRRTALIATLPFARMNHPDAAGRAARLRVEGWLDALGIDPSLTVRGAVTEWRHASGRHPLAASEGPGG